MKKAFGYGLILLSAAATADRRALAANSDPQNATSVGQFYIGNSSARQGYFGVDVRDVTPDEVTPLKLRDARGAEVILVDHDAPAGKAGLREHDVILQMNGQAIQTQEQVRKILHDSAPGRTIQLIISRDGQQMILNSQMSSREEVERAAWEQHLNAPDPDSQSLATETAERGSAGRGGAPEPDQDMPSSKSFIGGGALNPLYTGALLENMSAQLAGYFGVSKGQGVLVREVIANSPAEQAGMRAGDVIVRANGRAVTSTSEWTKALKSNQGKPLAVTVMRDKKEQTLTLNTEGKKRSSLDEPASEGERPIDVARLGMSLLPGR